MLGANVLLHKPRKVSRDEWQAAQPEVKFASVKKYAVPSPAPAAAASFKVPGALEGESLPVIKASAGAARTQSMANFTAGKWSGGSQLFWSGAKPGDRLELKFSVQSDGAYDLAGALTKARDYAIVELQLDGKTLGQPLDLYSTSVTTTGELSFGQHQLSAGDHQLSITITGANPSAAKAHMVGLDYIRLMPRN
jgi:hypothetical protein